MLALRCFRESFLSDQTHKFVIVCKYLKNYKYVHAFAVKILLNYSSKQNTNMLIYGYFSPLFPSISLYAGLQKFENDEIMTTGLLILAHNFMLE